MRMTTVPYDLRGWRRRMGYTQRQAGDALGLSENGYKQAEYRAADRPGQPCNKTVALLAQALEAPP